MILYVLLLIIGFVLLIKGADFFIDGASSLASNFKIPKIIIGLTIVAFGTSAPEFAVSMSALANNSADMVVGNVVGSNILNILLILGVAAVICPIKIKENTIKKEMPICILISTILVILFFDNFINHDVVNQLTRSDALIILAFFSVFIYYLIASLKNADKKEVEKPKFNLLKSIIFTILGLIGIIYGSNLVVDNASLIAKEIGISERVISLSIIAFGTSLPELVTAIIASKKKEQDLLLGNIIGSNIFNICVVLGIPIAIYGGAIINEFVLIDFIMLIGSSILLFIFSTTHKTITRLEGILMLLLFATYYLVVFII